MLRLCNRTQRYIFSSRRSCDLSSKFLPFSSSSSAPRPENSVQYTNDFKNPQQVPSPPPSILHRPKSLSPLPSSLSRTSLIALSATLASAVIAGYALTSTNTDTEWKQRTTHIYADVEHAIDRSSESFKRIVNQMKQTGVAAAVLWKSLRSVLSSANHEVRAGFEFRVAAFLADIAAANSGRRAAVVGAGGGAVVDWLLATVAVAGDNCGTQAEAARALAYLIADPSVSEAVFGRPHAVPYLLRFIFSSQPQRSNKQPRRSSFDVSDSLKGRSMLVAALMEIITSNCDSLDNVSFKPSLPGDAEMRDIAATIQVIEEGGMHLDESHGGEGEDGGKGIKGIGIKIIEGTTVLGLSRTNGLSESELSSASHFGASSYNPKNLLSNKIYDSSLAEANVTSAVVPGLWDDLLCQHVAVPFAAWALANWAMASDVNRSHIQELDHDGQAVMAALMAPERSVKWHGSLVARLLLEDHNLPLNDSVPDWSFSLLSTVSQASKSEDIPLAQVALSAFLVSIERSTAARKVVVKKGLHLMRETSKQTIKHKLVQEALAKALELLTSGDMHLSLEESQKWSGILLHWIFGNFSSDTIQSSATKILARIFEEYGPSSIPISQGWLALLLADILASSKTKSMKGSTQPKTDKVKTQIDQSNIYSAQQVANQLADAVVSLAINQLGIVTENADTLPLAELLNLEPFAGPFKKLKKDSMPKFDAADSALATLRGIKALTELCVEDSLHQNKITDFGILCLLRRLMLRDDYEQLAATEAYDASRAQELQDRVSNVSGEPSAKDTNDPSSVRVPPTAHIRRHAARLLTILSALPNVQKVIAADEPWRQWLEECATGKIPGCNDVKIRSYSRATLLNTFCNDQINRNTSNENVPDTSFQKQNHKCPRYVDFLFLINPELPHWKCPEEGLDNVGGMKTKKPNSVKKSWSDGNDSVEGSLSTPIDEPQSRSRSNEPSLDVVFVHGIRGGPFKSWRLAEDKSSTKSGLVEKIDEEAGKLGTFWPGEWLSADLPDARLFTLKYKTNVTQWSGASLPLQEVSSVLLEKLVAAGIGNRPVVFVSHSMGGLVVKQMLYQAKAANMDDLVNNTIGVVFYSVPHFGSKLADMPWTMGLVLRPAPTIGELRSGSPRLVELNDFIRHLHKKGMLEVLSFCETKVTPIVEGYGGWALRMEIVAIESAYPGFGELIVLESTDHVNSCKPLCRDDPSYKEVLDFLKTLKARYQRRHVSDTDHARDDCK